MNARPKISRVMSIQFNLRLPFFILRSLAISDRLVVLTSVPPGCSRSLRCSLHAHAVHLRSARLAPEISRHLHNHGRPASVHYCSSKARGMRRADNVHMESTHLPDPSITVIPTCANSYNQNIMSRHRVMTPDGPSRQQQEASPDQKPRLLLKVRRPKIGQARSGNGELHS